MPRQPEIPIDIMGSGRKLIACVWSGSTAKCRGCGDEIGFALTSNRKWIPFDVPDSDGAPAMPHWVSCENADQFRKKP